eukprot:TRINITY_DN65288_c0_g1_i2.p1 TRINITY_DN65288_c0_g1~~TRINITY_DN65288_c0_g1_i2.p1  ORF type:complete len:258 (-),score=60.99 TRINITY_DN65288_c0_g1_i2:35-808(-)
MWAPPPGTPGLAQDPIDDSWNRQRAVEEALRQALSVPQLRLAPRLLNHLAAALSELSPEELADSSAVLTLVEPFLHDALQKSGREAPHDCESDKMVANLCVDVCSGLLRSGAATPVSSVAPSPVPPADSPTPGQQAVRSRLSPSLSAAVRASSQDAQREAIVVAMRRVFAATLEEELQLAENEAPLAAALADCSDAELADEVFLRGLLERFALDAFHELGDWPPSEDEERLKKLASALSKELMAQRRCAATGAINID